MELFTIVNLPLFKGAAGDSGAPRSSAVCFTFFLWQADGFTAFRWHLKFPKALLL
jgi:hypothetical protein